MTVHELIEKLKRVDGDAEIAYECPPDSKGEDRWVVEDYYEDVDDTYAPRSVRAIVVLFS